MLYVNHQLPIQYIAVKEEDPKYTLETPWSWMGKNFTDKFTGRQGWYPVEEFNINIDHTKPGCRNLFI
jgi:hypothetical protein